MPILNYTTTIPVARTASEIQEILVRAGAHGILLEYDNTRMPVALTFTVNVEGRSIAFRLPSRWQGVYKILQKDHPRTKTAILEDQAKRVAWRVVKDWVISQLAIIQAGAAEVAEVFMPYAVNKSGLTMFEQFKNNLMLGPGDVVDGDYKK